MTEEEKLKIAQVVMEALKGHEQVNVCVGNQQNNLYSCNGNIYFSPDGKPREDGGKEEKGRIADSTIIAAIHELMKRKGDDRRFIMNNQYQWIGIFRVLTDQGLYSPKDYKGFCKHFETQKFRVPLSYDSLRQIAKDTLYDGKVSEWEYEADYEPQREKFDSILRVALTFEDILTAKI